MELMENVLLKDIHPDPNNPRKDLGDIDALAATFELNTANPGEPVNPIVVVRDGRYFRIVDGERRYRAMAKRKRMACCAIVCDDYSEAEAVIQMLATNLKMELTDEERSRGFQLSLRLGCDESVAEKAAGCAKGTAARIRRAQAAIADPDRCEQLTIDRLDAIAEFADDDDAVERLASASGNSWIYVRDKLRKEAKRRDEEAALRAAAEAAGIDLLDTLPDGAKGYSRCAAFTDPAKLEDAIGSCLIPDEALAVFVPGGEWSSPRVEFWCDSEDLRESDEERRIREITEEADRAADAFDDCIDAHFSYIAGLIGSVGFERARTQFPALWSLILELTIDGKGYDGSGIREHMRRIAAFNEAAGTDLDIEWTASLFCATLISVYPDIDRYDVKYAVAAERDDTDAVIHYLPGQIERVLQFADAFAADGFQIPQEEQRLYDAWRKYVKIYKGGEE